MRDVPAKLRGLPIASKWEGLEWTRVMLQLEAAKETHFGQEREAQVLRKMAGAVAGQQEVIYEEAGELTG